MPSSLSARNLSPLIPDTNISGEILFYIKSKQEDVRLKKMEKYEESGYVAEPPRLCKKM